jgi:MFS superfamily sulfate permease-like transporter
VVITFSIDLISPAGFRELRAFRTREFRWALCACAGVVLLGTLKGIMAAVVLSMLGLLHMANNPPVYVLRRKPNTSAFRPISDEHLEDESFPGLLILKTEGRIYFGNAQTVGDRMWQQIERAEPKVLLLDCSATPNFEFTALKLLNDADARLKDEGVELWLAALTPEALSLIQRSPLGERLGRERMFFTVPQAVDHYTSVRLSPAFAAAPAPA